jgi:hypothetical protein
MVLLRWAGDQMSKAILGHTMTTEAAPYQVRRPSQSFPVDIHPGLAE